MNATQAENLRILIRHMETNVSRTMNMEKYHSCGTPSCAIGEAATLPHFQALGLRLSANLDLFYRDHSGHGEAAKELFDEGPVRLFGVGCFNAWGSSTVTPQEWATEARKVLAEHGYSMDDKPADDGFAAFRAKILKPLDESVTTEHGTALFPK